MPTQQPPCAECKHCRHVHRFTNGSQQPTARDVFICNQFYDTIYWVMENFHQRQVHCIENKILLHLISPNVRVCHGSGGWSICNFLMAWGVETEWMQTWTSAASSVKYGSPFWWILVLASTITADVSRRRQCPDRWSHGRIMKYNNRAISSHLSDETTRWG